VAHIGETRSANGVLVGKPKGKRPLERSRPRWEEHIKTDIREMGKGCGMESSDSG
jgi:hypothetical protein